AYDAPFTNTPPNFTTTLSVVNEFGSPSMKTRGFGSVSQWYSIMSSLTMYAGSTAVPLPGVPVSRKGPFRNQRQLAGLRAQGLDPQPARDLRRRKHNVELRLHLAVDQVEQHRIGIDRRRPHLVRRTCDHLRDRALQPVHDAGIGCDGGAVASRFNLPDGAEILRRRWRAQRGVVAVPQRHVVRAQNPAHRIGQVLSLQIRELALLR